MFTKRVNSNYECLNGYYKKLRWFEMNNILIIEDNKDVNLMLAEALTDAGYEVESVFSGMDGMNKIKNYEYDLILLDLMLPYKSGDQILKEMRQFAETPVIVISAKDMVGTKVDILRLGADDYITKPFDLEEVIARIESNLRRFNKQRKESKIFQYKDIILDDSSKSISVQATLLELTAKEYMILELLMKNRGKVFTKANIYELVWQDEFLDDNNAVKIHISNIRNKIKKVNPNEEYIETVWGLGYRLYKG